MNQNKAQNRDNKRRKTGKKRPMVVDSKSVFVIQQEQIKRARKIKQKRQEEEND